MQMLSSYISLYAVLAVLINVDGSKDTGLNDAAFNFETTKRNIQNYIQSLQTSNIRLETTLKTDKTEARHGPRTTTLTYKMNTRNKNATDTALLHLEDSSHEFGPEAIPNTNRQSSYETRFNQRKRSRSAEEDNIMIKNTKKTDIQEIKARKYKRETHIDDRKPYQNNVNGQAHSTTPYPQNRDIKLKNNSENVNHSDYTQEAILNNTELSNETNISQNNSLSSLESMENNSEHINNSDYTQDANLNNTELSNETDISQQNNSLSSLESMENNFEYINYSNHTQDSNLNNTTLPNEIYISQENNSLSSLESMENNFELINHSDYTQDANLNNTELSNETDISQQNNSLSSLESMENNFKYINYSNYTQDANLNNTKLSNERYISQQNNSLSSLESMIDHRKTNYQVNLEVLVYVDTEFNDSISIVWNYTERFPNFKQLKMDDDMLNSTEHYVERRRDGLHHLNDSRSLKLLSSPKLFSDLLLRDEHLFEKRLTEFGEMQLLLTILGNIPKIKMNETNGLNCFNISKPNNLTDREVLNEENVKYPNQMELGLNDLKEILNKSKLTGNILFRWDNIINMTSEGEVCLESIDGELRNQTTQKGYKGKVKLSRLGEILRDFVYPIVYIVFLILGVIGNGTLLIMFARQKELRTSSNIMIFNLVIVDVLNLFINVPVYYVSKYYSEWIYLDGYGCRAYSSFRYLIHTVIMLSILALSAQRYCASVPVLNGKRSSCRLSARLINVLYVSSVWIISFIRAVPPLFVFEFRKGTCFPFSNSKLVKYLNILYFIIFCFLLPIMMGIFSLMTAKRLKMSVRNIPGEIANKNREVSRYRSAKVVTALAIVYAICFGPRFVWVFFMSYFRLDRRLPQYVLIDELTNYLMIPNSCLNPLALYIASGTFKKLFKRYLFVWRESDIIKHPPLERKITASSNTRVDYVSESLSGDMYGSKSSVISRHIPRKYSRE